MCIRDSHSTETALLRIHNDILRTIDQKKEVIIVLLDLSAAFDTIDHDILINRLNNKYGFTGTVLRWFESCIRERSQRVILGKAELWLYLERATSLLVINDYYVPPSINKKKVYSPILKLLRLELHKVQCLAHCYLFYILLL